MDTTINGQVYIELGFSESQGISSKILNYEEKYSDFRVDKLSKHSLN